KSAEFWQLNQLLEKEFALDLPDWNQELKRNDAFSFDSV
ncbi:MAG: hypothetical protein RIQ37_13, partial [Actinomycetota bacterium]